jgi:hypothetical protein
MRLVVLAETEVFIRLKYLNARRACTYSIRNVKKLQAIHMTIINLNTPVSINYKSNPTEPQF